MASKSKPPSIKISDFSHEGPPPHFVIFKLDNTYYKYVSDYADIIKDFVQEFKRSRKKMTVFNKIKDHRQIKLVKENTMFDTGSMIDRVIEGEDIEEVLTTTLDEKKKAKKGITIKGDAVKPKGDYDTPEKAARAIAAYIIRKKYGDDAVNKMAAKGMKKAKKGKK